MNTLSVSGSEASPSESQVHPTSAFLSVSLCLSFLHSLITRQVKSLKVWKNLATYFIHTLCGKKELCLSVKRWLLESLTGVLHAGLRLPVIHFQNYSKQAYLLVSVQAMFWARNTINFRRMSFNMNVSLVPIKQRQAERCHICLNSRNGIRTLQFSGKSWSKMVVNKYHDHFEDISGEVKKKRQHKESWLTQGMVPTIRPLCGPDGWTWICFPFVNPDAALHLVPISHIRSAFCTLTCASSCHWNPFPLPQPSAPAFIALLRLLPKWLLPTLVRYSNISLLECF